MALTVQKLSELSLDAVQQAQDFATQLVQEANPALDLRRGVIHDNVLALHAMLATATQENVDRVNRSTSLVQLLADPTLADDALVDQTAANYMVTRRVGTNATGHIAVVINANTSVTIANGLAFDAQGKVFVASGTFSSRTSLASIAGANDRLLTPLGDGTYVFTIEATAASTGSASQLRKNTMLFPQATIPHFVKAYAADDFSGGSDAETSTDLARRLQYGVAAKTFSGRTQMSATLRADSRFAGTVADSIIGFGDAEMLRDAHSVFPGSMGGRGDWYVRTAELPQRTTLTKTARLASIDSATGYGIWELSIGSDDAPGYYDVVQVIPGDVSNVAGTYAVLTDTRSVVTAGSTFVPDITTAEEAAYSRYQASVVTFLDTDTSSAGLVVGTSTKTYSVTLRAMPLISEAQELANSRSARNYGGDILVRAPIPCFLRVSFDLETSPGVATPDTDAIKSALAQAVNRFGFTGKLPASYLAEVIHNVIGGDRVFLSAIDMFGCIRQPDQTLRYIRATDILNIPDDFTQAVSGRTTAFFLDPADVAITVSVANVPEV